MWTCGGTLSGKSRLLPNFILTSSCTVQVDWRNAGRHHDPQNLQWPPTQNSFCLVRLRLHRHLLHSPCVPKPQVPRLATINFEDIYGSLFIWCGARCIVFCVQDVAESILSTRSTRRSMPVKPRNYFVCRLQQETARSVFIRTLKKNSSFSIYALRLASKIAQDIDNVRSSLPQICWVLGSRESASIMTRGSIITYLIRLGLDYHYHGCHLIIIPDGCFPVFSPIR